MDVRVSMNLAFVALATLWQNLFQTYGGPTFFKNTEETLPEQERLKSANCSQKMPNHVNFDVQEKNLILFTNSNSTLQVCMKFVFIVTYSVFLDPEWTTDNVSDLSL